MGVNTYDTLAKVIDFSLSQSEHPDYVLLTGDLSQDESLQSYNRLSAAVKKYECPVLYLPGNHDNRSLMQESFFAPGSAVVKADSLVIEPWQIIMLDSKVDKRVDGRLSDAELERLDNLLSLHSDKYALICVHHHPLAIGSSWMDSIKLQNSDALFAILDKHKQVKAVASEHVHQESQQELNGVSVMSSPSTCVQFRPGSDDFALDELLPGYRWFELYADGSFKTGVKRLSNVDIHLNREAKGY
jgi:Icc protein